MAINTYNAIVLEYYKEPEETGGIPTKVLLSGVWKDVSEIQIVINNIWKSVVAVEIVKDGVWKSVAD